MRAYIQRASVIRGRERDKGTGVVYDGCLFQSEYYPRPLLPFVHFCLFRAAPKKSEEGEIVVLTADGKGQLSFSAHQSGRAGGVAQNALAHASGLWPLATVESDGELNSDARNLPILAFTPPSANYIENP